MAASLMGLGALPASSLMSDLSATGCFSFILFVQCFDGFSYLRYFETVQENASRG